MINDGEMTVSDPKDPGFLDIPDPDMDMGNISNPDGFST